MFHWPLGETVQLELLSFKVDSGVKEPIAFFFFWVWGRIVSANGLQVVMLELNNEIFTIF